MTQEAEFVEALAVATDPSELATPLTVPDLLQRAARIWPERTALTDAGTNISLTWLQLARRVESLAVKLVRAGIGPGTAVVVAAPPDMDLVILAHAIFRTGAVFAPVNLKFTSSEIKHYVDLIRHEFSVVCVASQEHKEKFKQTETRTCIAFNHAAVDGQWLPVESFTGTQLLGPLPGPDDPAYIIATSGSTSFPKATLARHRAPVDLTRGLAWGMQVSHLDRYLNSLPLFHLGGLCFSTAGAALVGLELVTLADSTPAKILDAIKRYGITSTTNLDGIWLMVSQVPGFSVADLSTLKRCTLAGNSRFFETLKQWGIERVCVFYGMSEAHLATVMPPFVVDDYLRSNSQGRVVRSVDLRIFDPESEAELPEGTAGEIRFRSPSLMLRYVGSPDLTRQTMTDEGFIRSGDLGYLRDGYLFYLGRRKFMIKTGGENVSELEVEEFLYRNVPEIAEVAVVGAPHEVYGEIVCAFVEWRPGGSLAIEQLRERCRGRIANFKMPRRLETVDPGGWPRVGSTKINKLVLRERVRPAARNTDPIG